MHKDQALQHTSAILANWHNDWIILRIIPFGGMNQSVVYEMVSIRLIGV